MQGQRSLRGPLFPSIDYINRIARVRKDSDIRPIVFELGIGSSPSDNDKTMEEPNLPAVQRFMKDYALPTLDAQPSAIQLNEARRNYELKTVHFNTLPGLLFCVFALACGGCFVIRSMCLVVLGGCIKSDALLCVLSLLHCFCFGASGLILCVVVWYVFGGLLSLGPVLFSILFLPPWLDE
ncbi:hypothetical protein LWI28_025596 [Acer negundo]|uniref:Uncharacterized protein n=1 Tax=Acer negundo TaxID=4023 RepID=A0AAD5NKP0_ACENE|nr:hypothetical protein LWI28_025596 [Acer negundo]